MAGRELVIGDIHGCDVALEVLLDNLRPTADDTLVVLGDVVDRGPGTRRSVNLLLDVAHQCRLIFLMGNHEEMLLDALDEGELTGMWLQHGGRDTLASYGGYLDDIPGEHLDFFAAGLPYYETEREIYVHANLEPGVPLEEQEPAWLRWEHLTGTEAPHESGKRVICGHTGQPSGLPAVGNGWVCLDTLAYRNRYLTCLDVQTNVIYQSQQSGSYRFGVTLNDL